MALKTPAFLGRGLSAISSSLQRAFPTPALLDPPAAGIDISDSSIKWLMLTPDHREFRVSHWGELPLQDGIVVNGMIKDVAALAGALQEVKKHLGGVRFAHAALPEEAAYVFDMHVPAGSDREQIMRLIEFEFEGRVPIAPDQAVYDFDTIDAHDEGMDIAVAVFPRELSETYAAAFDAAGMQVLSLELEARSIGRAISRSDSDNSVVLLADFGRARTGFAVLRHNIPIFTSTVDVGGEMMTRALTEKLSLTPEQGQAFRNQQGLTQTEGEKSPGLDVIAGAASTLSDEITRHYHYWDTRRDEHGERMTPVSRVVFVGGSANLRGLTDYVASRVQAPAVLGDIWGRVCNFNTYIPPIDRKTSLQYATAVGLALRSYLV